MDINFTYSPAQDEIVARVVIGTSSVFTAQTPRGAANLVAEMTEEFRTKLAEFVDWQRAGQSTDQLVTRATAALPSVTQSPSCKGCGIAVERAGDLCAECAHKSHLKAPEGMVKLKDEGKPRYKTEGNFRDLPAPEIAEDDIVRVSES